MIKNKKQIENPIGVLTIEEIKESQIIQLDETQTWDEDCFSNASYDLRLGNEYYIPNDKTEQEYFINHGTPILNCPYRKKDDEKQIYLCSKDNDILRIKPFTSIVISTYEKLDIPENVVGRFDLRIKWALQGLILQVGTQIEPGYKGRLFGLLHNFSKKEICIPLKSRFLTVEFSYTIKPISPIIKGKKRKPFNNLKDFLDLNQAIDGTLENYLAEIRRLSDNMEDTKKKMEDGYSKLLEANRWRSTLFIAIATVAFSIGVPLIVTKFTVDKDDYPFRKVYEMETRNNEINLKLDSLLNQNKTAMDSIYNLNHQIQGLNEEIHILQLKTKGKGNGK